MTELIAILEASFVPTVWSSWYGLIHPSIRFYTWHEWDGWMISVVSRLVVSRIELWSIIATVDVVLDPSLSPTTIDRTPGECPRALALWMRKGDSQQYSLKEAVCHYRCAIVVPVEFLSGHLHWPTLFSDGDGGGPCDEFWSSWEIYDCYGGIDLNPGSLGRMVNAKSTRER